MVILTSVLTRLKTFGLITSQGRYLLSPVYCNNSSGQVHIRGVVVPSLSKDTGLSILGSSPLLFDMKGGLQLLDHPPLFPQELPYQFHIQHIEHCGPWFIILFGVNRKNCFNLTRKHLRVYILLAIPAHQVFLLLLQRCTLQLQEGFCWNGFLSEVRHQPVRHQQVYCFRRHFLNKRCV